MEGKLNFLSNIRSKYILKDSIFSMLISRKKLNLVCYNKCLQNKLELNLENYRRESGKIKIGERNGYGKIYISGENILLFEGGFVDSKKNGKGKEYYEEGILKFEGEYTNNRRNGKGKEYYKNGNIKYEGEYLNGKMNGKGKEYYITGQKYFEGEYNEGKKWNGIGYNLKGIKIYEISNGEGYIKECNKFGGLKFEGQYLNGERNGKGVFYYKKGTIKFEGEFYKGNRWNGKGYNPQGEEKYQIINGKGFIREYKENGLILFEGQYINGEITGKGREYDFQIELYKNNKNSGNVQLVIKGIYIFEGIYLNGKRNGKSKVYINKNLIFEGNNSNGTVNGNAKVFNNIKLIYEIPYLYGKKEGFGTDSKGIL